MPEKSHQPMPYTKTCAPRLSVFPRLDLIHLNHAADIDDLLHEVKHMTGEVFNSEESASSFYKQHLATHNAPVCLCSLHRHTGSPFAGRRLAEYHAAPAENWVGVALDFILDNPIGCTLAEDWQFRSIELQVNQKTSHKTVRRHPAHPDRELLEALYDLEAELYERHGALSTDALRDFWCSFEMHRHLTAHALKMARYHDDYSEPITKALDNVRRHVADYVRDVLGVSDTSAEAKRAHGVLQEKILLLKSDSGATVEELEDLFNLDRKTLRKLELGETVRQGTINKAPACRDTLECLTKRLNENRSQRHRLK